MSVKVIVIDDEVEDLLHFGRILEAEGCPTLRLLTSDLEEERERIVGFAPQLAIIDSRFGDSELEGLTVITKLQKILPNIHVVVCSQLADDGSKRNWFERRYEDVPRVKGTMGKSPFPTARQILSYLEN